QLAGADPATGEALDGSVQLAVQADGSVRVTPLGRARAEHRVRTVAVGAARWHWQAGGIDGWVEDVSHETEARAGGQGEAGELRAPFNGRVVALPAAAG